MAVSLTISKTVAGSAVSDSLSGGGTGLDFGTCNNNEYVPLINKSSNTGKQTLYVRHNAVTDPITSLATYIAAFTQTYGGADSSSNDYVALKALGQASGTSANNNDGLSGGLRVEHGADLSASLGASAFDATRAQVKIYGDNGTDGISLASAFSMHVDAATYWNGSTEVVATTPVTGKVGISTDTVLGNRAHYSFRYYLPDAATAGGILQANLVFAYSYTA